MNIIRGNPPYADEIVPRPERPELKPETAEDLVSYKCISCHTLERVHLYTGSDWDCVVGRMKAYGMRLTDEEMQKIITYLSNRNEKANTVESQANTPPSP